MVATETRKRGRHRSRNVLTVSSSYETWLRENGLGAELDRIAATRADYNASKPKPNGYRQYTTEGLNQLIAKAEARLALMRAELAYRS